MEFRAGINSDCCCKACFPIQGLVCGYAPASRLKRWLIMVVPLEAYVDDSNRGQTKSAYVLAGFLGRVESWLAFGHAWQAVLDERPALAYFKSREAAYRIEQFRGWSVDDVNARVAKFVSVILNPEFRLRRTRIAIPIKHYQRIFRGKVDRRLDNPFFLPHYSMIQRTLRYLAIERREKDKINFIFDEASNREKRLIRMAWDFFTTYAAKDTKPLIGDEPDFRNDKDMLPLQAADLYARHARKYFDARFKGDDYDDPVWTALDAMEGTERDWTAADFKGVFDTIPRTPEQRRAIFDHLKKGAF